MVYYIYLLFISEKQLQNVLGKYFGENFIYIQSGADFSSNSPLVLLSS